MNGLRMSLTHVSGQAKYVEFFLAENIIKNSPSWAGQ